MHQVTRKEELIDTYDAVHGLALLELQQSIGQFHLILQKQVQLRYSTCLGSSDIIKKDVTILVNVAIPQIPR
jgi:hypothetical protein